MLNFLKNVPPAPSANVAGLARFRMYSAGFSLVELMISILVGVTVLSGVVSIYVTSVQSSGSTLKITGLNQELRNTMDIMTRDIRRAGYWGGVNGAIGAVTAVGPPATAASNTNPFENLVISAFGGEAAGSCITYTYDDAGNGGAVVAADQKGFRLNNQAVELRKDGLACTAGGWENITDENTSEITQLLFTLVAQPPIDIDGTGPNTSTINVREVQISLTGRLKNDTSVTRTFQETVRIRADRWSP